MVCPRRGGDFSRLVPEVVRTVASVAQPGSNGVQNGPTMAVRVRELRRSYPARRRAGRSNRPAVEALRGVDLTVAAGEVHGLLGPNGAGKTTLCRILATLLLPTGGTAAVLGYDVVDRAADVRARVGLVLGGERGLYPKLTARQNLLFWAALYGVAGRARRRLVDQLLDRVGLAEWGGERVETYSSGMRQRLHLARGLVGSPSLLLLDEPTSGMDPVSAIEFRALVADLRDRGCTILLTTHNLAEAQDLCDRVTLIDHGAVVAAGRPAELVSLVQDIRRIEAESVPEPVLAQLPAIDGVGPVARLAGGSIRIDVRGDAVEGVLRRLIDAGVVSLTTSAPDLEAVYLALIGDRGMAVRR